MALSWPRQAIFCYTLLTLTSGQIFTGSNSPVTNSSRAISPPPGISDACNSTFSNKLACDSIFPSIALYGAFPTQDELTSLCASDCLRSLYDLRTSQEKSCSNDTVVSSRKTWPITAMTDIMLWAYKFTCYKDSTGHLCAPIFDAWANGNATNASCSDCVLDTYQLSLNSSLLYHDAAASALASLTASCSATGYGVNTPPALTLSVPSTTTTSSSTYATSSAACLANYTITANDDCHSISLSQNVSTAGLLYLNNLQTGCAKFPAADTALCQNQICVSFSGKIYQPASADASVATTAAPAPTNVANNTNSQCSVYYTVQSGDTCSTIAITLKIPLQDFYFLNPELNNTDCSNLILGAAYCVGAVGTISTYPDYNGRPMNPCVAGTAAADPTCYATSYETFEPWSFPMATTFARNNTISIVGSMTAIPASWINSTSSVSHRIIKSATVASTRIAKSKAVTSARIIKSMTVAFSTDPEMTNSASDTIDDLMTTSAASTSGSTIATSIMSSMTEMSTSTATPDTSSIGLSSLAMLKSSSKMPSPSSSASSTSDFQNAQSYDLYCLRSSPDRIAF